MPFDINKVSPLQLVEDKKSLIVRIWPDGTWAEKDEIKDGDYSHMSDDFIDIDMWDFDSWKGTPNEALIYQIGDEIFGPNELPDNY